MNIEKQYLNILGDLVTNGKLYPNRTGVSAYKVPPQIIQHDMSVGFPLLTTKKMAWKTMKVELEGFIKGITTKKWYQDRKCHIWDAWANPDKIPYSNDPKIQDKMKQEDDLGKIYGYQWNNFGSSNKSIVEIDPKNTQYSITGNVELPENEDESCYDIKYYDIACKGNPVLEFAEELEHNLFTNWYDMIRRCYNKNSSSYKYYGWKGVKVCDRWLCYENYRKDITKLSRWQDKLRDFKNYSLDKDYYGSKIYAPDVCIFLHKSENRMYNSSYLYRVFDKDEEYYFLTKQQIAEFLNSNRDILNKYLNKDKLYNGYYIEKCNKENKLYRYKLPINQIREIITKLKSNPNDRRLICSAWNSSELNEMALVPCHYAWQVTTRGNKLDLTWTQRSCDIFLGIPFNISSYALLLHLIAKEVGMEEGILTGFLCDVHLYENHVEQATEQLKRIPKKLPSVQTDLTSIFDWGYNDTQLNHYESYGSLKAPVAV